MNRFILGIDLGQVSDWTCFSILDEVLVGRTRPELLDLQLGYHGKTTYTRAYHLRYLHRPPIGTTYPKINELVLNLVNQPILYHNVDILVDATGVGRPVVQEMQKLGINVTPIVIVPGAGGVVSADEDGYIHVPKVDVVSSVQLLFGQGRLKYPNMTLIPELEKEFDRFKIKRTKAGNMTYESWRESDHDDIVLSVGLATWWATYSRGDFKSDPDRPREEEKPYNPVRDYRSARFR